MNKEKKCWEPKFKAESKTQEANYFERMLAVYCLLITILDGRKQESSTRSSKQRKLQVARKLPGKNTKF